MTYAKQNLKTIRTTIARNLRALTPVNRHMNLVEYRLMFPQAFAKFTPLDIFARAERKAQQGNWYPACGGTETPFWSRNGYHLQYLWQPSTGRHAYINLQTDIILSDDEARAALGTF
jgi:hypothetical protein